MSNVEQGFAQVTVRGNIAIDDEKALIALGNEEKIFFVNVRAHERTLIERLATSRPETHEPPEMHELFGCLMEMFSFRIAHAEITGFDDDEHDHFEARLIFEGQGQNTEKRVAVPCRPADMLIIGLTMGTPIRIPREFFDTLHDIRSSIQHFPHYPLARDNAPPEEPPAEAADGKTAGGPDDASGEMLDDDPIDPPSDDDVPF